MDEFDNHFSHHYREKGARESDGDFRHGYTINLKKKKLQYHAILKRCIGYADWRINIPESTLPMRMAVYAGHLGENTDPTCETCGARGNDKKELEVMVRAGKGIKIFCHRCYDNLSYDDH